MKKYVNLPRIKEDLLRTHASGDINALDMLDRWEGSLEEYNE